MKMHLSELEFIRLLPQFMRDDAAVKGLSVAMDIIIPQLSESIKYLTTWDHIDSLSESELDELAWELNILWYELDADIEVKRDVIKNSDKVYQHLGTKWAVENVIRSYFNAGYITEWFEYDGLPGRFRVHSSNPAITGERLPSFLNMIRKVKRASAKLEAIILELESTGTITFGAGSELSGRLDVWPLVAREIDSIGTITYGVGTEISEPMKVFPLATKSMEITSEAATLGALAYGRGLTIEIFPQGGTVNE